MSGRDGLEIGTYGDINTTATLAGTMRAEARYRDWDGEVRKVTATARTAKAAKLALRAKLNTRGAPTGFGSQLTPNSSVEELATAWLADLEARPDLAPGTKDVYRWELGSLVLPTFRRLRLREATTGRVDQFLMRQSAVSYAHARHSRVVLSLMFNYARRHDALPFNPVAGAARLKKPKKKVTALSYAQLEQIRHAAATWRTGPGVRGPKPDGQVRDFIEVLIGTGDRIGEGLALRRCDIDDSRRGEGKPMRVTVAGTLVTIKGKGTYRQDFPKTDNSRRTLEVAEFAAEVIRRRLEATDGAEPEHLLFFARTGRPLAPYNVRRTLRAMLAEGGIDFEVTPHTFRRTGGTVIARATDSQTAADALGNTKEIAEAHYIETPEPTPIISPAIHLAALAPELTLSDQQDKDAA